MPEKHTSFTSEALIGSPRSTLTGVFVLGKFDFCLRNWTLLTFALSL